MVAWPGEHGLADVPRGWPAGALGTGDARVVGRGCARWAGLSMFQSPREMDKSAWHVE